jgi:hypothetical protein
MNLSDIKHRSHLPKFLCSNGLNGNAVELGVFKGFYSKIMLQGGFKCVYSIDRWAGDRGHDDQEYQNALQFLKGFGKRSVVLRKSFLEAVVDFPDGFFDFVYVDGYAHTGQDGGDFLDVWWAKVRSGGVFAGHDYDARFPETIAVIDRFVAAKDVEMFLTKDDGKHDLPSWLVLKP